MEIGPFLVLENVRDDAAGVGGAAAFPIHADEVAPGGAFVSAFKLAHSIAHFLNEFVHFQHAAHGVDEAVAVPRALVAQEEAFGDVDCVEGVVVGVKVAQQVRCRLDIGHQSLLSLPGAA